jgi:hypothetical protein
LNADRVIPNKIIKEYLSRKRLLEVSIGLSSNRLLGWLTDYLLYPFIIYEFGVIKGGFINTFFSFVACFFLIILYDWLKRDYLLIETVKKLRDYNGTQKTGRILSWILRQGKPVIFLFLSIKEDPFITTVYMREKANQYAGLTKRDWGIFLSSVIISNAYWIFVCYMGISLVEWAWKNIKFGV